MVVVANLQRHDLLAFDACIEEYVLHMSRVPICRVRTHNDLGVHASVNGVQLRHHQEFHWIAWTLFRTAIFVYAFIPGGFGQGTGWAARLGGGQAPPGAAAAARVRPQPGTAAATAAANWHQMRAQVPFIYELSRAVYASRDVDFWKEKTERREECL